MKPTNYSAELVEQWAYSLPNISYDDRKEIDRLKSALLTAQHFMLPDCGNILPRPNTVLPNISDIIRPPFPTVALEYTAVNGTLARHQIASPKRIALAQCDGDGVTITPFAYIGTEKKWAPPTISVKFMYDTDGEQMTYMVRPVLLDLCKKVSEMSGMYGKDLMAAWVGDAMDELNAYFDLCQALACSNVHTESILAPEKLNKARAKRGKTPLPDYRILTLGGQRHGCVANSGDGTKTVRSHLRRGHIRRLASGNRTWVNACLVNGGKDGFLDKSYLVA